MTQSTVQIQNFLAENAERFQQELCQWLRMPSISTDSTYADDVRAAANWLGNKFRDDLGFAAEIIETVGQPIVLAKSPKVEGAATVLVYGHYDVQPPDPLDEWDTPPFEPQVRHGKIFARGATDDKGQLLTHVLSCEAWMKTVGSLPVNITFLIEGEEECGGKGLTEFLSGKYDGDGPRVEEKIAADICVISDMAQYGPGQPAVTYGLRGMAYFELHITGPFQDQHSGLVGGAITNPANALCQMLAAMHDESGRVDVPGFYDDVIPLDDRERAEFAALEFADAAFRENLQVGALSGEAGYSTLERRWARPTLDVNGIWSGYQGEGAKTIVPGKAAAKFSCRLVPNQDPLTIATAVEQKLREVCPPGVEMKLIRYHGAPGVVVPLDNPFMEAASVAIEKGFGNKPVFIRSGGSIPVVGQFKTQFGIDTLMLGWGQEDDNLHGPNEKINLDDFHNGIKSSAYLWEEIAGLKTT